MNPKPVIDKKKCTVCGKCVAICPKEVLYIENREVKLYNNECMLCSHCYDVCKFNAVSFNNTLKNLKFNTFKYKEKLIDSKEISPALLVNIFRSRRSIGVLRRRDQRRYCA
jgi:ferredoxin